MIGWAQAMAVNGLTKIKRIHRPYMTHLQRNHILRRDHAGVIKYQYPLRTLQRIRPNNLNFQIQKCQIIREAHESKQNKSFCSSQFVCCIRSFFQAFSIWRILRRMGVPYPCIIAYRRWLKRFHNPWLSYSVPIALAIGIGDMLQQLLEEIGHLEQKTVGKGITIPWTTKIKYLFKHFDYKNFDYQRTGKLMLIGFFVLGPMLSKWNSFVIKRIGFTLQHVYLMKRTAMDVLLFAPVAAFVCLSLFDYERLYACYPNIGPIWRKGLKQAFLDILQFNLMTRVIMNFAICLLVASCLRKFVRRPYEILFFTYVSSVLYKHNIGNIRQRKYPPPPPPPLKGRPKCRRGPIEKNEHDVTCET